MISANSENTVHENKVIMVTGGSGLVGQAIKWNLEESSQVNYKKASNETWIFLSSKDADLRYCYLISVAHTKEILNK